VGYANFFGMPGWTVPRPKLGERVIDGAGEGPTSRVDQSTVSGMGRHVADMLQQLLGFNELGFLIPRRDQLGM
jgi:hypothetical protein